MAFRVGQKVVCVDDVARDPRFVSNLHGLRRGMVYTVAWCGAYTNVLGETSECIHVDEIARPVRPAYRKYGVVPYLASRFRRVVSRSTDISIFTRMLDDTHAPQPLEPAMTGG